MGFYLRVGQRFRVYSAMCQTYEQAFGPFYFDVEVLRLYQHKQYPLQTSWGDLYLTHVAPNYQGELDRACKNIALAHKLFREDGRTWNFSPDLINGHGDWYLPDIFIWQHLWCWLVGNDVVEYLG